MTDDSSRPRSRPGARLRPRRFATEVLLLQLAVVTAIVVLTSAVFAAIAVQRLAREAESTALAVAQSVASDTDVRAEVAALSVDGTPIDEGALAAGDLQRTAVAAQLRTGALFVVITDDRGVRLAHPDPTRIGERVSTSPDAALRGEEVVSWERGTLGESARAKVPIVAPTADDPRSGAGGAGSAGGSADVPGGAGAPTGSGDAGSARVADAADVVGEVSVGYAPARVYETLARDSLPVIGVALLALAIGVVASVLIRRRLDRLTLGLQPEELAALVQNQQAVLGGVAEGVLAVSRDGVVTVCNDLAPRLLGLAPGPVVGRRVDSLELPGVLVEMLVGTSPDGRGGAGRAPQTGTGPADTTLVVGPHVLLVDVRAVSHDGVDLGRVAVLRDRTDVEALTRRLDAVGAMTTALRAQRHEFANRLHAVSGLLELGRTEQARGYLADVLDHGPLRYPVAHADRLTEPYLQAFLGAKGVEAAERGVLLKLGPETLVSGTVVEAGDVTTVLGNLVDNAVRAAVAGDVSPAWIEVEVLDDGTDLHLSVMDSGRGVADADALFERAAGGSDAGGGAASLPPDGAVDPDDPSRVHGLGFGLPLSRDIARRRGGDVWLGSPGGDGHGAVFCARLADAVQPPAPPERIDP
ncbi:sensor histidine kinase [Frigoribacterium sp. CFBP9030]|uniref:sensor histidine kinase n=1 Tax=Frigoribacterium sp. CFBP9030 TaxID=3096537 RepID=UPI002A6A5A69|nr:sensor histidine kinase [Frigoribacterium sp. CFBP9030]MDY0892525.1 sensor histidine kinase [Frigoribacterium sp. CFBP9030]